MANPTHTSNSFASSSGASSISPGAAAASRSARPSDDEILGIVAGPNASPSAQTADDRVADESGDASAAATQAEPAEFRTLFDANPPLRDAWRDAQTFRELFPDVDSAREIHELFPTAADARAAEAQIGDLAKLDALFFSNRPEAHAELAAAVYRLNPLSFRSLARMMQNIASAEPGAAPSNSGNASGNASGSAAREAARHAAPDAANAIAIPNAANANAQAAAAADPFAPAAATQDASRVNDAARANAITPAQQAFFQEANAVAVGGVIDAIHSQVDRLLPSGTADGAKRRIVGEIYREVENSLRANASFVEQLRQAFRAGHASPENRDAVAGLVVARARQALPTIAKRVINEWTSGVVAQSNARLDRQRSAERRVDIAGGSPGGEGRRALMPRDIDYRRLSDQDILNL